MQAANTLGDIWFVRVLTPAGLGLSAIIVLLLNFLVVFGEAGLTASLVRQQARTQRR
jgi:O-antigen/teichoic acid export membrane protein